MRAILTYHSIDPTGSVISIGSDEFARHVAWLANGRVHVVPLRELSRLDDDVDALALTFDDAYTSFGEIAAPMLAAHGLPATVFAVSEHAGGTNDWGGASEPGIPTLPLLDWDALARLSSVGFEIGAHTRRHPHLAAVGPARLEDEVLGSANVIADRVGVRPESFAYPYGSVSTRAADVVRRSFQVGVTTVLRTLRNDEDSALLPRLDTYYLKAAGSLESWGSAAFRRRLWLRAQARRVRQYVVSGRGAQ